ncbi:MAG TPA: FAD-dependent oxidoreductase, partial [Cellvibrionaceae bacterium]
MPESQNIAIVGTGISGLSAAHMLSKQHRVTVFESADTIGGHTATKAVHVNSGEYHIDTGFIVYNDRTYPNFIKLLKKLGVDGQTTEMGFSVKAEAIDLEYSGCSVNGLFAKRHSIIDIEHWKMLKDIVRFNRHCTRLYSQNAIDTQATLGDFVAQQGYGERFRNYYLLPMVSAIWSSGEGTSALMPLKFFVDFFHNHGLLTIFNQPQWYTVKGGSHSYLAPLTAPFADQIHTGRPVTRIRRMGDKVQLLTPNQLFEFDQVVLACHSDQALALLEDPSSKEADILGAMTYTPNDVVLHTDTSLLP